MIVVFGSIGIDFVTRVPTIPAPGETVIGPAFEVFPGGKGANQALAAARCGADVQLAGAVGDDTSQEPALALLKSAGVGLGAVASLAGARTQTAFISIDQQGQNAIAVALGASLLARAQALGSVSMEPGDIFLAQRELPDRETARALSLARAAGATTILNAAPGTGFPGDLMDNVDILIVNEHEARDVSSALNLETTNPVEAGIAIAKARRINVVVTLGHEGAALCGSEGVLSFPPFTVDVVDTTAAGDSFCGAFAAALAAGHNIGDAVRRGNAAGALACTKPGAQPSIPMKTEVDRLAGGD